VTTITPLSGFHQLPTWAMLTEEDKTLQKCVIAATTAKITTIHVVPAIPVICIL